jgi:hypothetical protein
MNRSICAAVALAFVVVPAYAAHRYDRKLEQAAMKIVAQNIGDIRAGFAYDQKPRFVVVQDALMPGGWPQHDGSPPATEPPAAPASR